MEINSLAARLLAKMDEYQFPRILSDPITGTAAKHESRRTKHTQTNRARLRNHAKLHVVAYVARAS
jgi:hypothetical protein